MSKQPATTPSAGPVLTGAELLAAIDIERAAAHAIIDALPARRRALLEADADDAAFDALDRDQARAERQLARLDLRERGAVQHARRDHEVVLSATWAAHRDQFQAKAAEVVAALREAVERHDELKLIAAAAANATSGNAHYLPVLNQVPLPSAVDAFEWATASLPDAVHIPPIEADQHTVEFLKSHGSYNAGEQATYAAAQAWPLVDSGLAAWAGKVPRRPVQRVHRPITSPAVHLVMLQDDGSYRRGQVVRMNPRDAALAIRNGAARRAELAEVKA